jgi:hypothetical protein
MAKEYIVIRGKKIVTKSARLDVAKLRFFPENPRIYSAVGADETEPSQDDIQAKLAKMEHVKELLQDIKLNGDLIDPIIVKDGTFEVLEGNSRLAAYRELIKQDPIKWGKMRSTILPGDIDEGSVFALLGQYHIKGKKDWLPFEQAGFLHRRHTKQDIEIDVLAKELGIKPTDAGALIGTYDFMFEHGVKDPAKWSYFYELTKSRKVKKHRKEFEQFDEVIVGKIKSGKVGTALEFRGGLKLLGDAQSKVVKKFVEEEYSFEDAISAVEISGNASEAFKRLNRFRTWMNKPETKDAISGAKGEEKKKIAFEIKKIDNILTSHLKK